MGLFDKVRAQNSEAADDKKIYDHIRSQVEEVRSSANRIAHEGLWMTNIAYLLGYDGVTWNTQSRQFQPINRVGSSIKKNRLYVNKILPSAQNRLARLCKNPPKYELRPENNDTDAKEDARFSQQILVSMWEKLSLDQKRIPLYMWTQECGHAYIYIGWDPTKGKHMVNPETGEAGFEGEVRADVVSGFEIFPDPMAKSFEDALDSWLIRAKVRKLDYFKNQYPEKGHLVKEEPVWLLSAQYETRINSMNTRGPSQGSTNEQNKNSAIELVKYEARSPKYPNGRMIIAANGIILEDKELPVGEIPFAKFDDIVVGGKYYSEAVITHARPVQDQYNQTIRRRAEWTNKLLAGKYTSPRGNGLTQETLNDQSGEVLEYDASPNLPNAGEPKALDVPAIPQYAYQETAELEKEFDNIFGISEVSRGTLPSASIPAIGMQLLTEQDDTRIGVMTEMNEHAWARVGTLILLYCQKFWVMPRKLKFAGKSQQYTVHEVSGEDIKNTDVMVVRGSTKPGSKTLQNQEILNRYDRGLLGNPQDPKVIEKVNAMTEFGDTSEVFQDYGLDMAQIQRGIESMEDGQPVEIHEMDNHALWIQELNRYRKGDKYSALDPAIQELFAAAIEQSIAALMKMQNMVPPTPMEQEQRFIAENPSPAPGGGEGEAFPDQGEAPPQPELDPAMAAGGGP